MLEVWLVSVGSFGHCIVFYGDCFRTIFFIEYCGHSSPVLMCVFFICLHFRVHSCSSFRRAVIGAIPGYTSFSRTRYT